VEQLATLDSYCELNKTSLVFKRDVTQDEWKHVFNSLKLIEGCVQFWIGDCLKYREQKWGMYDDVAEEIGISKESLRHYKDVAEKIESGNRLPELTYTHHLQVASLPPEKQELFLKKAVDENLTVRELRQEIRKEQREEKQALPLPDNKYQVIYADPPWKYNDTCEEGAIQTGGATRHYSTMSIQELCDLDIEKISADDCALFLWVTSPLLEECFDVINAWGFEYKASFVWDKIKHNMGHYNSVRHEFLLVCTKGSCTPDNMKLFDSVQSIEKTDKHSQKPNEFYEIIETLYQGPKIELFARNNRDGWSVWGNEV
jgi:N6-adenosine-specific RNA methylase IME4